MGAILQQVSDHFSFIFQIVQNTPKFSALRVSCGDAISASFTEATEYATIFENHRPVFEFGQSWDAVAYEKKECTVAEFRQDFLAISN